MAKSQMSDLKGMKQELDRMTAEVRDLEARQAEMDQRKKAVDVTDTSAAIKQLQAIDAEGRGIEQILPGKRRRIAELQTAYQKAEQEDKQQRTAGLRATEKALALEIWGMALAMGEKFSALDQNSAAIIAAGGTPNRYYLGEIARSIQGAKMIAQMYEPELIGLPPLPTPEEKRRIEQRRDLNAKIQRGKKTLQQIADGLFTIPNTSPRQAKEELQIELATAEQELAALQGA